ncbi:MAG: glycogen synthase GlgA [Butyricicoccus sp.]|nr:glycogen synthase GlgA [Butyricicoccus sp.]
MKKNILFVASECVPFIKTGGLADVAGALPKNIDPEEFDVRVVMPNYQAIPEKFRNEFQYLTHFYMDLGGLGMVYVGVMTYEYEGITYYFIDNQYYFGGPKPYGDIHWDIEKFCYFSKAALSILPTVGFRPDVIHCHDWQTGVVPVFLNTLFQGNEFYRGIRTVMTVHNLRFQGVWDIPTLKTYTGLPDEVFTMDCMEFNRDANMLKGGLTMSDRITTVSDTYAKEITYQFYGEGLDGLMRAKEDILRGIVNGIDYDVYDPNTDDCIDTKFSTRNYLKGKAANKVALQKELGLPEDPDVMMIAMVTRLTDQKGLDLVNWVLEKMVDGPIQLVVVGTGDPAYEAMFRDMAEKHPDKVYAYIKFNEAFAHKVYAGADAMLMPSLFEPCGLTQLISLRYGTVPIVRETGGLRDTVQNYNDEEQSGTGFSFPNYNADEMYDTIVRAEELYYHNRKAWNAMVKRGMTTDYSWGSSARKYEELYRELYAQTQADIAKWIEAEAAAKEAWLAAEAAWLAEMEAAAQAEAEAAALALALAQEEAAAKAAAEAEEAAEEPAAE